MTMDHPSRTETLVSLPVRILAEAPSDPVLSVDGAVGAPGLNLLDDGVEGCRHPSLRLLRPIRAAMPRKLPG